LSNGFFAKIENIQAALEQIVAVQLLIGSIRSLADYPGLRG